MRIKAVVFVVVLALTGSRGLRQASGLDDHPAQLSLPATVSAP